MVWRVVCVCVHVCASLLAYVHVRMCACVRERQRANSGNITPQGD